MPTDFNFDDLYATNAATVLRYCRARTGQAAEDVAQEAWARVWQRQHQCTGNPRAWMWSVVRTQLANSFRSARPSTDLPDTIPARDVYAALDAALDVGTVLGRLTPPQREVLTDWLADRYQPRQQKVKLHRAIKKARQLVSEAHPPTV